MASDLELASSRVDELRQAGRLRDAIDVLTQTNARERDLGHEQLLISLRHELGLATCADPPPAREAPERGAPVELTGFPPEVDAADLARVDLRAALRDQDCVLVRGLVDADHVARLRHDIDRAFDSYVEPFSPLPDDGDGYFSPYNTASDLPMIRDWLFKTGAMMATDSPPSFFDLMEVLETAGVIELMTAYFGQRPVISSDKTTLRRVMAGAGIEWHQDSAFMGPEYPAANLWISLADTTDSPGLELVQGPLGRVVETGTKDASYPLSVGAEVVEAMHDTAPVVSPWFGAGDALIFGGLLLHRTSPDPSPTQPRYATETWFFAPDSFPDQQQVPLAL